MPSMRRSLFMLLACSQRATAVELAGMAGSPVALLPLLVEEDGGTEEP